MEILSLNATLRIQIPSEVATHQKTARANPQCVLGKNLASRWWAWEGGRHAVVAGTKRAVAGRSWPGQAARGTPLLTVKEADPGGYATATMSAKRRGGGTDCEMRWTIVCMHRCLAVSSGRMVTRRPFSQ